jgi:glutathione synthase/RimK-type ligase-like ATP-grasp enzyme
LGCASPDRQFVIAVQPDDYGPGNSSSPIWQRAIRRAGHQVREVDVRAADILQQLRGCDGLMWRHAHYPDHQQIARRLLPVVEHALGLPVYPDQRTCWHYDDKIAQSYLFQTLGIPSPTTWVWFDRSAASAWARTAAYPLVLKLTAGASSSNVMLVRSYAEAERALARLFGDGVRPLYPVRTPFGWGRGRLLRTLYLTRRALRNISTFAVFGTEPEPEPTRGDWQLHKNYVLFQEFLHDNSYDTRVTVIGNRAFGFRRFNRDDDFRASGSGKLDFAPSGVDRAFVRLAFRTAHMLGCQSCAIDGLWRGNEAVVGEVSYAYVSWAVHACPGHWELCGDPDSGELVWREGPMWPEEAQVADFLVRVNERRWNSNESGRFASCGAELPMVAKGTSG